jgi:hypothetical protein
VVVLDHQHIGVGQRGGEVVHATLRRGDARGVLSPGLEEDGDGVLSQCRHDLGDDWPFVVEVDADDIGTELVEQVQRGGNVGCSTTTRSPSRTTTWAYSVERVHRPVDDGQGLRARTASHRGAGPRDRA